MCRDAFRWEWNASVRATSLCGLGRPALTLLQSMVTRALGSNPGTVRFALAWWLRVCIVLSIAVLTANYAIAQSLTVTANPDPELQAMFSTPPQVTRTFVRADVLRTYVEVYDNSKEAHAITVATSVQDAHTGRSVFQNEDRRVVQASSKPEGQGIRTDIPLKDFTAGTYVLHVKGTSTSGSRTAERDVLFEVK